jgi:hypothetical protein
VTSADADRATTTSTSSTASPAPDADVLEEGDCVHAVGTILDEVACSDPTATHRVAAEAVSEGLCPEGTDITSTERRIAGVTRVACLALGASDRGPAYDGHYEVGSCVAITGGVQSGTGIVGGTPSEVACDDPQAVRRVTATGSPTGDDCPPDTVADLVTGPERLCLAAL